MDAVLDELAGRALHLRSILFTTWLAVGLGLVALAVLASARLSPGAARERVLVAASLAAVALLGSPVVAAAWLLFALAFHAVVESPARPLALGGAVVLLAAMVVLPVVAIGPLGDLGGHAREFVAFATNMAVLRFYGYFRDRRTGGAAREPLRRFLLAMFFFPTFVNGPVEVPRAMQAGWGPPAWAEGGRRIGAGVVKLALAGLAFPPGWTGVLAAGAAAPPAQLWLWGALLWVWFYLSFSAWSDVAIGLGRLCGRRVGENFDRPWAARDPADFWRRWHLSLGLWLRDYVYVPLGGNRRHRALNVLAVFLVSAAWHVWGSLKLLGFGFYPMHAWGGFLLWGLLSALGVVASPALARVSPGGGWGLGARRAGTFLFASWCWIPFFLPAGVPLGAAVAMLLRMLWPF